MNAFAPVTSTEPATPSDHASMMSAYYRAWSIHRVTAMPLQKVVQPSSNVLWIGSYFDLAKPWADASWVLLDLDADMLAIGQQTLPGLPAVLGDIRQLPFSERFATVVALGAVTAYLLDDHSVERAAQALRSAVVKTPTARLLIDAYDRDTIHRTNYFNGRGEWMHADARFAHTVETQHLSYDAGVFLTTLTISEDGKSESRPRRFRFRQRAFTGSELAQAFQKQGLRLIDAHTDPSQGRLYQTYAPVEA